MAIEGSIIVNLSAGNNSVDLPDSGLTIVGLLHQGPYISIPIDTSRNAIFPTMNTSNTATSLLRKVSFKVNGNALNVYSPVAALAVFYYGTPLPNSKKLEDYAGVVTPIALSAATSGSGTINLPGGKMAITGLTATYSSTEGYVQVSFSTGTGQQFNAFVVSNEVTDFNDIIPLQLIGAQSFTVAITSGAPVTDTVYVYVFYKYVA